VKGLVVASVLLIASPAAAQTNLRNAKIESRPGADLAATVQSLSNAAGPLWIGYAVPAQHPDWNACCGNWSDDGSRCCGVCHLDEGRSSGNSVTGRTAQSAIQLEAPTQAVVLLRVEQREVQRIRIYSASCEIDAGGAAIHWLTGVPTAASVDVLARYAARNEGEGERHDGVVNGAMAAIAAHKDPAADRALATLMAAGRPARTRKQAAFWAGNARGRAGFELVRAALLDASNDETFRKHATFAVSQSREPEAVDTLIRVAKSDTDPRVRGEAIFWLAQKAGRQAAAAITDAIEHDPDTKVKERAVFALSQLPKDDGVPKLIAVARTNRNPAVRKQAIFWLGQSRDPRALSFFEEILAK
jgi:hypothetical protein